MSAPLQTDVRAASPAPPDPWSREALAGRLVEVSGAAASACLTAAASRVLEAQKARELVAWVSGTSSSFYPPDLARWGIDLEALVVVRVPCRRGRQRPDRGRACQLLAAATRLARAGAFGLLVVDLGPVRELPMADQARLAGLATRDGTIVLLLTRKRQDAPSLGSLVSLRVEAGRARGAGDGFWVRLRALKDKRRGPGWSYEEHVDGPPGLR